MDEEWMSIKENFKFNWVTLEWAVAQKAPHVLCDIGVYQWLDHSYLSSTNSPVEWALTIFFTQHTVFCCTFYFSPPATVTALNDLTILFSAPDTGSRVSTLEKDKSSMSSSVAPGGRSSMSSVVGLTAGLASAAKQQRSEHHAASNNGRSQATFTFSSCVGSRFSCTFLDSLYTRHSFRTG